MRMKQECYVGIDGVWHHRGACLLCVEDGDRVVVGSKYRGVVQGVGQLRTDTIGQYRVIGVVTEQGKSLNSGTLVLTDTRDIAYVD